MTHYQKSKFPAENKKTAEDSVMKEVSVAVDGEEARISFVDHMHGEMSVRESPVLK